VAATLGRMQAADAGFRWTDAWSVWGALPFWLLVSALFSVPDQAAVQRYLSAKDVNTARTSYFIHALGGTFVLAGLIYVGLGLLTFYRDHPEQLRAEWVVNLDGSRREPALDDRGLPLLDPANPAHQITPQNLKRLIAEHRILRPNDKLPFTNADELLDPMTGRVQIEKLALYKPGEGHEVILRRGAGDELLPHFIATRLSWGAAGLAVAALISAALASLAAGIHAMAAVLFVDFFRAKQAALSELGELRLVQKLMFVAAVAVAAVSLLGLQGGEFSAALLALGGALGAPLLAVLLLGMLTRRATSAAASGTLLLGSVVSLVLIVVSKFMSAGVVQVGFAVSEIWVMIVGFAFTLLVGYLLSFFLGNRKSKRDLRGLVLGCGRLGVQARDEEIPIITDPAEAGAAGR
jgi:Na+/proline symporter